MRTLIAFLLAPLATLLLTVVAPSQWGLFAFLTLFYAYPLMLVAGLPIYLYFRRKGWLKLSQVVGTGAAVGVVIPTLVTLPLGVGTLRDSPDPSIHVVALLGLPLLGAISGAAVALVFWLIAIAPTSRAPHANTP